MRTGGVTHALLREVVPGRHYAVAPVRNAGIDTFDDVRSDPGLSDFGWPGLFVSGTSSEGTTVDARRDFELFERDKKRRIRPTRPASGRCLTACRECSVTTAAMRMTAIGTTSEDDMTMTVANPMTAGRALRKCAAATMTTTTIATLNTANHREKRRLADLLEFD